MSGQDHGDAGTATWLAMRAWLAERTGRAVGRDDCARAFDVHPNHVARLFRRHGGSSFTQTLLHLRLERACALLRSSDCPIATVARSCGFNDSSYFVRRFREHIGLPPDRWRHSQESSAKVSRAMLFPASG